MRLCLAFAFQNEAPWLRLHLPVWVESGAFAGMVALDGGSSDDSAAYVRSQGGDVFERPFDWNFSAHMNALITHCEALEYDALLRLDPDELIYPSLPGQVAQWLCEWEFVALPRYAFIGDRLHHNPQWLPDWQVRAFRLHRGARYDGLVHEQLNYAGRPMLFAPGVPEHYIYHYGWMLALEMRRQREAQYAGLMGGNTDPAAHLADGYPYSEPFDGAQPLDPLVIGVRAPLED